MAKLKGFVVWVSICSALGFAPSANCQGLSEFPNYHLKVVADPASKRLAVSGRVRLPATDQQDQISFSLADTMKVLDLREVTTQGELSAHIVPDPAKGKYHYLIQLPVPWMKEHPVELSFSLQSAKDTGFVFATGDIVSFAEGGGTGWYPQFGPSGNGTGTLEFVIPDGFTAIATGTRQAADSQIFNVTSPSSFSFSVGRYSVIHVNGTVPVDGYFLESRVSARQDLESLAAIVKNLTQEFGPYPYGRFSIVEVPDSEAVGFAGASTPGLILAVESALNGPFSIPYYSHELSHQWWGDLVVHAEEDHGNDMLDEALAQYGSLTTVEALLGPFAAEQYRRDGAPNYDSNQSARGYLLIAAAGLDHPLGALPEGPLSHEIADSKGFLVYDLLARTIGREHFHDALRSITRDYAFRSITWSDFLTAIQKHSSQNLDWFFEQWFNHVGAPEWHSEWLGRGQSVDLTVSQPEPFYRADVEIQLVAADGRTSSKVIRVAGPITTVSLPVDFPVSRIDVDPHYLVLHWTPAFREEATALAIVTRANFERIGGNSDAAQNDFTSALQKVPDPDRWGVGFRAEVGLGRVATSRHDLSAARSHFLNALQEPVRPPEELPWAYYRLAGVAVSLNDVALLKWAIAGTRTADSSLPSPTGAAKLADALLKGAP